MSEILDFSVQTETGRHSRKFLSLRYKSLSGVAKEPRTNQSIAFQKHENQMKQNNQSKALLLGDDSESSDSSSSPDEKIAAKTKAKKQIKEVSDSSERLTINKKFASQFEEKERQKELRRAKDILLNEEDEEFSDSESDESEDEDAKLLSTKLDTKIIKTLNMIKKKDPKIYDSKTTWFSDPESGSEDEDDEKEGTEKKSKRKTYKDVVREQILKDQGDNDSEDEEGKYGEKSFHHKSQLLYDREQQELRKAFLSAADKGEVGDDEGGENEGMFAVKPKTKEQLEDEEKELARELEELEKIEAREQERQKEADDKFLLNYLKNKMWKEPTKASLEEEEDFDDENDLDAADLFESKYNFRFEQLQEEKSRLQEEERAGLSHGIGLGVSSDGMQVIGHARQVAGSLRRVEDKRKLQREERKERKEKEKRQKQEELKRLKNLKREELRARLSKIGDIGGLKELGILDESILDEDWDPEKHEKLMNQQFDDEYYQEDDADFQQYYSSYAEDPTQDPVNSQLLEGDDYEEDQDDLPPVAEKKDKKKRRKNKKSQEEDQSEEQYQEEYAEGEGEEWNEETKQSVKAMVNELYELDYEDIVAGLPCRFKYRSVEPEDYGLSTEEILLADDTELNRYVSLKHLATYERRPWQKSEEQTQKRRRRLRKIVKEKLRQLSEEEQETAQESPAGGDEDLDEQPEEDEDEQMEPEPAAQGEKKRRRRKRKAEDPDEPLERTYEHSEPQPPASKKNKKNKNKQPDEQADGQQQKKKNRRHKKAKREETDPEKKRLNLFK